jgi:hypothetical protein
MLQVYMGVLGTCGSRAFLKIEAQAQIITAVSLKQKICFFDVQHLRVTYSAPL